MQITHERARDQTTNQRELAGKSRKRPKKHFRYMYVTVDHMPIRPARLQPGKRRRERRILVGYRGETIGVYLSVACHQRFS